VSAVAVRVSAIVVLVAGQPGCDLHTTGEVGALVPPTAEKTRRCRSSR
jgi:hypothetical protein